MTNRPERYKAQEIEHLIMTIRGQRVVLDFGLGAIYRVTTKPRVITICDILFRIPNFLTLCALRYAPCEKLVAIER